MAHTALANKWRPQKFNQVIGQEHVVTAISNALNNERVHHAFLFSGTRGVGKTTIARLFAKALNCETGVDSEPCGVCDACVAVEEGRFIDLIEVDAASRTKVDDTRELLDNVQYRPTQGRYKVYLIDEVHMLSTHSFNALLKTLEEPPEHVKFLLATTEPEKLPTTVLSRCIQFHLKALDATLIESRLTEIGSEEGLKFEPQAMALLATAARGSVRDGLSLLDQSIAFGDSEIKYTAVRDMLGLLDDQYIFDLARGILANDISSVMGTVDQMSKRSLDYEQALDALLTLFYHISLYKLAPEALAHQQVNKDDLAALGEKTAADELQLFYQIGVSGKKELSVICQPRMGFEMVLLRMIAFRPISNETSQNTVSSVKKNEKIIKKQSIKKNTSSDELDFKHIQKQQVAESKPAAENADPGDNGTSFDFTKWRKDIMTADISGINKQILYNLAPMAWDDASETLAVQLDNHMGHLLNAKRKTEITALLAGFFSENMQLHVTLLPVNALEAQTITQYIAAENVQQQQEQVDTFLQDPNVQQMQALFDAKVDSQRIKRLDNTVESSN